MLDPTSSKMKSDLINAEMVKFDISNFINNIFISEQEATMTICEIIIASLIMCKIIIRVTILIIL